MAKLAKNQLKTMQNFAVLKIIIMLTTLYVSFAIWKIKNIQHQIYYYAIFIPIPKLREHYTGITSLAEIPKYSKCVFWFG